MTRDAAIDRALAVGLGAAATLLYLATPPALVNLDGLGYLKLLPHNFAAGHLLYMPLLRLATRLCGGDGLGAGRLVNALLGGVGVALTWGIVRQVWSHAGAGESRAAATAGAAGLAVSYGYWSQGNDVEAYAAATVALLATVRLVLAYRARPRAGRAVAVGGMLGVAVLCHLTHVALSLFVVVALRRWADSARRGWAHAALALISGGALALSAYAYAALAVRGHDLGGAVRWIASAQHGFFYGGGAARLGDATAGLAKAVVWSPYRYEAGATRVLAQFLLGAAPLVALGVAAWRQARALAALDLAVGLAWAAPYALTGLAFFASDSERWLFVLPALWLVGGVLIARARRRVWVGALVIAYVGGLNLATAVLPAHRDTEPRQRAARVASQLADGDVVVFPGHSWDEYVSFLAQAGVSPFPVAYYLARDGAEACFARLAREMALADVAGAHVWALRIYDEDGDSRGVAELEQLGLSRAALRARVAAGRVTTLVALDGGPPLVRLDPP